MVEQGYYSNRLSHLEKRKIEVSSRIYADKLSLKVINEEIARCEDEMQTLGRNLEDEIKAKDNIITSLNQELINKNDEIQSLNLKINQLTNKLNESKQEKKIKKLKKKIDNKDTQIKELKLKNKQLFNQLNRYEQEIDNYEIFIDLFKKTDNRDVKCSENNIFKKIVDSNQNNI